MTPATSVETEVDVFLPTLLHSSAGGESAVTIRGRTLADALDDLRARHPLLRVHLWEEGGRLRRHVVLFYNGQSVGTMKSLDVPLRPGDQLQVVQAVSGG